MGFRAPAEEWPGETGRGMAGGGVKRVSQWLESAQGPQYCPTLGQKGRTESQSFARLLSSFLSETTGTSSQNSTFSMHAAIEDIMALEPQPPKP